MNTTAPKVDVILGAAGYGGGFPLFGNAVAETINKTDRSLSVIPRNTAGSAENIGLLDVGKLDIALVAAEPAYGHSRVLAAEGATSRLCARSIPALACLRC